MNYSKKSKTKRSTLSFGYILVLSIIIVVMFSKCSDKPHPATVVNPARIFTDNMVLQKGIPLPIFGKATPGGEVTVEFLDKKKTTIAKEDSTWNLVLDPITVYGGPYHFKIIGKDTIDIKNVLVGEVWLASGQSNMEMPMSLWGNDRYSQEIKNANYKNIRLLTVKRGVSKVPEDNIPTDGWKVCTPENISDFSAVAYFFARKLHKDLNVPIGVINSNYGGTPLEGWMPAGCFDKYPNIEDVVKSLTRKYKTSDTTAEAVLIRADNWKKKVDTLYFKDVPDITFEDANFDDSGWPQMQLPSLWEEQGLKGVDGIVWFRKTFTLAEKPDSGYVLHLGKVDDQEVTYINGVCVGSTYFFDKPRVYQVPSNVLKPGKNVIAVQVMDNGGGGGIWGEKKDLCLVAANGKRTDLSGKWKYKLLDSLTFAPNPPDQPFSSSVPTSLYNYMINPLIPYGIKGVIWYQGEFNVGRANEYASLFPIMIKSWREKWGEGDFPFLFVQLANFLERKPIPTESDWAELREAQTKALSLPNTGMAVTIDVGEGDNIHYSDKQDVGYRLALNALHLTYGKNVPYTGPGFKSMDIKDGKIIITFSNVYDGLKVKGDELKGFAIAGKDGKYKWAEAKITGKDKVIVWNNSVTHPVSVRYAWADNPECNLYNEAALPALPFRTDQMLLEGEQ